jgi:copper homeostasis protein
VTGRVLIEAAVETVEDAQAAADGGADRLELCAALDLGGLTPTLGLLAEVRAVTQLPVVVMLRPRGGDFVYTPAECRVMKRDLEAFRPHKVAGFVLGVLDESGRVHEAACRELVGLAAGVPVVFHRAFDRTPDPIAALETVIALGFARILTSGREATGLAGSPTIRKLREVAGGRIEILPCGRVTAKTAADILSETGCDQLHGSFAEAIPEPAAPGRRGYASRSRTSAAEVEAVRVAVDRPT